ncbi:MAG: DUF4416 family protein [Candidatus Lernaella stagnicola]|nr:DUF4416 family protein [Candidatus Lernaella stagnicola]
MSKPHEMGPVMLVIGLLFRPDCDYAALKARLENEFGPMQDQSAVIDFNFSDYYDKEMGPGLKRRLVSFARLIDASEIASIKLRTNAVEDEWADAAGRTVNLDPGYLCSHNFVLATGKGFAHRPYLRDGIYADLTLFWQDGAWRELPWTYADYRDDVLQRALADWREIYRGILQEQRGRGETADD